MPPQQPTFNNKGDISANNRFGAESAMGPTLLAAVSDFTGVSANYKLVWSTADESSSFGGILQKLRFKALGTNVATVARVFINNGGDKSLAVNNVFYGEKALPATTANNTAGTPDTDYVMDITLPPGCNVYVGLGTTVVAGWRCMGIGIIF